MGRTRRKQGGCRWRRLARPLAGRHSRACCRPPTSDGPRGQLHPDRPSLRFARGRSCALPCRPPVGFIPLLLRLRPRFGAAEGMASGYVGPPACLWGLALLRRGLPPRLRGRNGRRGTCPSIPLGLARNPRAGLCWWRTPRRPPPVGRRFRPRAGKLRRMAVGLGPWNSLVGLLLVRRGAIGGLGALLRASPHAGARASAPPWALAGPRAPTWAGFRAQSGGGRRGDGGAGPRRGCLLCPPAPGWRVLRRVLPSGGLRLGFKGLLCAAAPRWRMLWRMPPSGGGRLGSAILRKHRPLPLLFVTPPCVPQPLRAALGSCLGGASRLATRCRRCRR